MEREVDAHRLLRAIFEQGKPAKRTIAPLLCHLSDGYLGKRLETYSIQQSCYIKSDRGRQRNV